MIHISMDELGLIIGFIWLVLLTFLVWQISMAGFKWSNVLPKRKVNALTEKKLPY